MASGLLESIDRSTQLAGYNRLALLLFRTHGRQLFGINVFKVQEVVPVPPITSMPSTHPLVRGVAELRGSIVPVIDLASALGEQALSSPAHLIVTEYNRTVQGFLVSAVDRIIHVDVERVLPPPGGANDYSYLTAVTRQGDQLIEIVDVEKVLAEVRGQVLTLPDTLTGRARSGNVGRILVADDSRVARSQIEKVLQHVGAECILVNDGREALRMLQSFADRGPVSEQVSMVISDIEMPGMDGYTLTTEIRRDPRLRELYVLLHTSLSGVFNNAMVQKVGANRFIAKFGANELADAVLERLAGAAAPAAAA